MSSKPEEDFSNYMEHLAAAEMEQQKEQAMLNAHEEWRRTTWSGWLVTKLLEAANHIRPFISAVTEALTEEGNTWGRILSIFLRLSIVAVFIVAALIAGRVIQMLVGKEIFVEQEVVVVEEVPRSRAEKEGIKEGEEELTIAQARERLGNEAVTEALKEVQKEEETRRGKRRSARDKKDQ